MDVFYDTLRTVFPSILILIVVYLMMSGFLDNEDKRRRSERLATSQKQALPIRLQAYERLALLLERISPTSLLLRVKASSLNKSEYLLLLQQSIRAEFEHNLSQQVYVSEHVWDMVSTAKSAMVSLINTVAAELPEDATGAELSKAILNKTMEMGPLPTRTALAVLRREIAQEF
ncbi:MAG TPA: hypothetical protein DCE58_00750 [Cryomorphaceae bacterium]|nr:hypothetical protein [Cryomorphaceae bacterium]